MNDLILQKSILFDLIMDIWGKDEKEILLYLIIGYFITTEYNKK